MRENWTRKIYLLILQVYVLVGWVGHCDDISNLKVGGASQTIDRQSHTRSCTVEQRTGTAGNNTHTHQHHAALSRLLQLESDVLQATVKGSWRV